MKQRSTSGLVEYALDVYDTLLRERAVVLSGTVPAQSPKRDVFIAIAMRQGCEVNPAGRGLRMHSPEFLGGKPVES